MVDGSEGYHKPGKGNEILKQKDFVRIFLRTGSKQACG